jgi:SAM-dependent methyltransferase
LAPDAVLLARPGNAHFAEIRDLIYPDEVERTCGRDDMTGGVEKGQGNNDVQIEYWNGRVGDLWARNQERLDRAFAALTDIFIDKMAPLNGAKILDTGCGCGDLALALAARIGPAGHVAGIDVSKPMIERARARAETWGKAAHDRATTTWTEADAATHAFAAEYDLIVSRFGVMFFSEPAAAFRNLRRALKPGGRCAFLCWGPLDINAWVTVPLGTLRDLFAPQPPADPHAPGPFALSDPKRMETILREAGASKIEATLIKAPVLLGRADDKTGPALKERAVDDALELILRTGPVSALLREVDEATKVEARRRVASALLPFAVEGDVKLEGACWLYTCS